MVASNLPRIALLTLAGPYIDKFSRRKTIYTLDFLSAFIFMYAFSSSNDEGLV